MAKTKRMTPARSVKCDACGMDGHAPPDSRHRRCSGKQGAPIKPKHTNWSNTGKWR